MSLFHGDSGYNPADWNNDLPTRLFATDRYPKGRLNVYSKPDILSVVQEILTDKELQVIKDSSFGELFNLPVSWCPISCQLIHSLLSRQLVTLKNYEFWTVFGGLPLRFSLVEFASLTGLHCGEFPSWYKPEDDPVIDIGKGSTWEKFIGTDPNTTLADIAAMLRQDTDMPSWRRIGLALILIIDGVLIANRQTHKPTPIYVNMLEDQNTVLNFPWGRESFLRTLAAISPGKRIPGKGEDPIVTLRQHLQQQTFSLKGFPLVLQLLAFKCIPSLLAKLPNGTDLQPLSEASFIGLGRLTVFRLKDVRSAEDASPLIVTPKLQLGDGYPAGWAEWDGEVLDKKVALLEKLIDQGHKFQRKEWPGGDDSLPPYVPKVLTPNVAHKKHILSRKQGKQPISHTKIRNKPLQKRSSKRKQRKIHNYFAPNPQTIEEVIQWTEKRLNEQQVEFQMEMQEQQAKFKKELKDRVKLEVDRQMKTKGRGPKFGRLSNPTKMKCMSKKRKTLHTPTPYTSSPTRSATPLELFQPGFEQDDGSVGWEGISSKEIGENSKLMNQPDIQTSPQANTRIEDLIIEVQDIHCENQTAEQGAHISDSTLNQELDQPIGHKPLIDADVSEEDLTSLVEKITGQPAVSAASVDVPVEAPQPDILGEKTLRNYMRELRPRKAKLKHPKQLASLPSSDSDKAHKDTVAECLSDGSSASKNVDEIIVTDQERALSTFLKSRPSHSSRELFVQPDMETYKMFHQYIISNPDRLHITPTKFDFTNQFFLDLSKPTHWVDTKHMEVFMHFFSMLHKETMKKERSQFASPFMISRLQDKYKSFRASRNKIRFRWNTFVNEFAMNSGEQWLDDIDSIYVPMLLKAKHWVGLVINLKLKSIEVLDSNCSVVKDNKLDSLIGPIAQMLPYIMKSCGAILISQHYDLTPFNVKRQEGIYQNERGGDCGPVSAKFLEMYVNCAGPGDMANITDTDVDSMRKQYALQIYAEYVAPLY